MQVLANELHKCANEITRIPLPSQVLLNQRYHQLKTEIHDIHYNYEIIVRHFLTPRISENPDSDSVIFVYYLK